MGRLEGKSVIITGAGSGIGRAASLLFTREGARLIAVDRSESVKETAKLVSDAGGTVEAVMADAGSEADVKAFIDKAVSKYGRLDAIWANAGVSGGLVPIPEQTVEHWQEVLRINLIGPFLAIKHAMPHMIRQKSGSIVCTASVAGLKAGASGFVLKDSSVAAIISSIIAVMSGERVMASAVANRVLEMLTGTATPNEFYDGMTNREIEILKLLATGVPNKQIAYRLKISEKTVRNHVSNMYEKLGIYDRSQAVLYAVKKGLVEV